MSGSAERGISVSAVIPTRNRPDLVVNAVRSVLSQTSESLLEVVVVVDGADPETSRVLAELDDSRVVVIENTVSRGAPAARNAGVAAARGNWIAFLDDDDEWVPEKLKIQIEFAVASGYQLPIVASRCIVRFSDREAIWPRRRPYLPLSEYLLARDSMAMGEGALYTSTLLCKKELCLLQPFDVSLPRCQEVDFALHASRHTGVGIEFVDEPLTVVSQSDGRPRITNSADWRASLKWVESVKAMITRRAYASYVCVTVSSQAARQGEWRAAPMLCARVLKHGSPKIRDLGFFMATWLVPRSIQLAVRRVGFSSRGTPSRIAKAIDR